MSDSAKWLDGDGYPTEEALDRIEKWEIFSAEESEENCRDLLGFVKSIWWSPDWGWYEKDGEYRISTPEEAAGKMREIAKQFADDSEIAHGYADDLMVEVLVGHGYEDLVIAYKGIEKWYA